MSDIMLGYGRFAEKNFVPEAEKAKPVTTYGHEVRQWCHSDYTWSEWKPCTDEQALEYSKDEMFQVRAVLCASSQTERRELSDEELAPLIQKAVADVYGHCGAPPSNKVVAVVRAVLQAASAKIS
jgi:hypothetical protein